jgi:hypothetical protein
MRKMSFLLIFFCSSCLASKKYDNYIGKTRDYLVTVEGKPVDIKTDTLTGAKLSYWKAVKVHNPKYSSVTKIVTFYVNNNNEVYKWSTWKDKETGPTGKPPMAIE